MYCFDFLFQFFGKKGVPEIYTPEELFKSITGCDYSDKVTLQQVIKMKPHLVDRPEIDVDDNFEINWEKAQAGEIPPIEKIITDVDIALVEPLQS